MDNRVWKDLLLRIDSIESSLTQLGHYLEKSDAINLASVDITAPLIQLHEDSQNNHIYTSHGYTKLLNDITSILNELYFHQQREIIQLRNSIHTTSDFIEKNIEYLNANPGMDTLANQIESNNLLMIDEVVPSFANDWNELPPAEDDEEHGLLSSQHHSPHLKYLDHKRKLNALKKRLSRRIENNYYALQMILDAKVHCQTSISNMLECYTHLLVVEAHNCGVSNALYRANIALKSHALSIRQNRFLDSSEVGSNVDIPSSFVLFH